MHPSPIMFALSNVGIDHRILTHAERLRILSLFCAHYLARSDACRAQQKRERNAKAAGGEAKSQKKTNEAARNVMCMTCRQTFLLTVREPALIQHASDRHNKVSPHSRIH